ncbi:hypothetical protein D3C85_1052590 [compost metagenome]
MGPQDADRLCLISTGVWRPNLYGRGLGWHPAPARAPAQDANCNRFDIAIVAKRAVGSVCAAGHDQPAFAADDLERLGMKGALIVSQHVQCHGLDMRRSPARPIRCRARGCRIVSMHKDLFEAKTLGERGHSGSVVKIRRGDCKPCGSSELGCEVLKLGTDAAGQSVQNPEIATVSLTHDGTPQICGHLLATLGGVMAHPRFTCEQFKQLCHVPESRGREAGM